MGMSDAALTRLFLYMSCIITLSGTLGGLIAAACATFALQRFQFISLPDAYYVTHLPAELSPFIIVAVVVCAFLLAVLAALLPARTVQSMAIATILKGIPS